MAKTMRAIQAYWASCFVSQWKMWKVH